MINIMEIEPHEVSADLKGYAIGIYGGPGLGKTTTALSSEKALLIAAEKGYKTHPGVFPVDINGWTDMLTVVAQLKQPAAKEKYSTIVIDTLDDLAFYAEQYVLQMNGAAKMNDIPWGGGYALLEQMFRKLFKDLMRDYGLIVIAHESVKIDDKDPDNEIKYSTLAVSKKVKGIVYGLLDLMIYVQGDRSRPGVTTMHFKPTESWDAKTRFPNIIDSDILSYDNIVKAINGAIGGFATAESHKQYYPEDKVFTNEEFLAAQAETNQIAQAKAAELGVAKVTGSIMAILGKKISEADVGDTAALKALTGELKSM